MSSATRKSVRLSSSVSSTKQHGSLREVAGNTVTHKGGKRGIKVKSGGENKSEVHLAAGSDSEQSDDQEESCTLTKRMKENVLDNAEFFSKLGIGSAKLQFDEVKDVKKTKPSSRGFKEQKVKEVLPRRKSLRLQNKDPGGSEQPVKDVIETQLTSRYDLPRKAVSLQMSEVLKNNQEEAAHERFMDSLREISDTKKGKCKVKVEPDLQRFVKSMEQMTIKETQVAKVVPERVFSVAIHPTERALLVAAGDKWGRVGLWDINSVSNQDGVFCYEPHVRPVKHLCFPGNQPDTLYSCSYDGSLRCLNFTHGKFQELYSTPPDEDILVTGFDFFSPTSMIVSQGEGGLVLLDTRCQNEAKLHRIRQKTVRSVSIHPQQTEYIATAHADNDVCIWDLRKLDVKRPQFVHILPHSKIVESAFFSPLTGKFLLTTAADDRLRVYDTSNVGQSADLHCSISHNNHTGRWLSKFRAVWHPSREDVFITGSMHRPRQIEMFSASGQMVQTFQDDSFLCSVCSLNAFHPSLNMLVGGNSSGRLHVFK